MVFQTSSVAALAAKAASAVMTISGFHHQIEDDVGAWYAQHRLPFMAAMPGCIGARKLLATAGWGKHSILYEYVSLEAREQHFIPHEEQAHDAASWTARILPQLVHAPCSPAVGRRIWPLPS
jgi:hypothetical protein